MSNTPPTRLRPIAAFAFAAGLILGTPWVGAGETSPSATSTYELFIGLDVFVQAGDKTGRVEQVSRGKVEVVTEGGAREISLRGLKVEHCDHTAKVSATRVTIENVRTECTSVIGDTPHDEIFHDLAIDKIQEEGVIRSEEAAFEAALENAIPQDRAHAAEIARLKSEKSQRQMAADARSNATLSYVGMLLDDGTTPAHDTATLKASFTMSAPQPIADAYVVIFARLRNPVDPRAVIHRVLLREIRRLGPRPTTITIQQPGVPPASVIELFEIHVYSGNRQLSTNLAHGRVTVSRDEAVEFLRLQRLNLHPGETLPPEILTAFLPATAASLIVPAEAQRSVNLGLDAQGNVVAVTFSPGEAGRNDAAIAAMIRATPFLPAQDGGEPIASELVMTLGDFLD